MFARVSKNFPVKIFYRWYIVPFKKWNKQILWEKKKGNSLNLVLFHNVELILHRLGFTLIMTHESNTWPMYIIWVKISFKFKLYLSEKVASEYWLLVGMLPIAIVICWDYLIYISTIFCRAWTGDQAAATHVSNIVGKES